MKNDLRELDRQLAWVSDLDTDYAGAIALAAERADTVCGYQTAPKEADNTLGVSTAVHSCAYYVKFVHDLDSMGKRRPDSARQFLFIAKATSNGLQQFLRDSASSLMGDSKAVGK